MKSLSFLWGGVGWKPETGAPETPFPSSTKRFPAQGTTFLLSTEWQQYTIDLTGFDLSYILGGFAWVANSNNNPNGAVFYLDDIQYELSPRALEARLNEPRFLASYTTLPIQPVPSDCNTGNAAGDIVLPSGWEPNNRTGTVPIPGFYCEQPQKFFETEQSAVDVGNNAWTMVALLALHKATNEISYLDAARRIGIFINSFQNNNTVLFQGFQGGIKDPETENPSLRNLSSAEHNLDVYAAYKVMGEITGEEIWSDGAQHARTFIEAL